MNKLEGIEKSEAIVRTVANAIAAKAWRSTAESAAIGWLKRSEKSRKADVLAYVREQFDAAGAGSNGRWQS